MNIRNTIAMYCLAALALATSLVPNAPGQAFDLSWRTIDGGGAVFSAGAAFELGGTIGQPDAGSAGQPMSGGPYELVGGFWPVAMSPASTLPGDLDGDCDVDLSDLSSCLSGFGCTPPATCLCDIDGDGDADLSDLAMLLANFGAAC